MSYRIGTVCMYGTVTNGKFKSDEGTVMGVVQQKRLINLMEQNLASGVTTTYSKLKQNLSALTKMLKIISVLPQERRLLRIGSNLLPMFDHHSFGAMYESEMVAGCDFKKLIDTKLAYCKTIIDQHDIRVVCHPDQYNIINSQDEKTRLRTHRTLRMHKYFMERLTTPELGAINVHYSGHLPDIPEIDDIQDLIPWISFENDDTLPHAKTLARAGLDQTLNACERYGVKMCFDLHHYFVETGEFLPVTDPRVKRIIATWPDGVRPIMHLSQSREPDGMTPQKLAKHSDMITDEELIKYSADYLEFADIEIEAKFKNVAVLDYSNRVKKYILS